MLFFLCFAVLWKIKLSLSPAAAVAKYYNEHVCVCMCVSVSVFAPTGSTAKTDEICDILARSATSRVSIVVTSSSVATSTPFIPSTTVAPFSEHFVRRQAALRLQKLYRRTHRYIQRIIKRFRTKME